MSRKTRKLIWSTPLVAVLAVAGALAIFAALAPNSTLAHEGFEASDPPGEVTGLTATAEGRTVIKLSWTPPASGLGGTVESYRIDVSEDTYEWSSLVADTGNTDTTYTHTGLAPATLLYYRVFALNSAGTSPVSVDETYAFAETAAAGGPGPVLRLRATGGAGKVDLSWNAPTDNGGAKIRGYCIVAVGVPSTETTPFPNHTAQGCESSDTDLENGSTPDPVTADPGGTFVRAPGSTTFAHSGLDNGATWRYRAYAVNSAGISTIASNIASAKVSGTARVQAPKHLRAVVANSATEGEDDVRLYWTETNTGVPTGITIMVQHRSTTAAAWADLDSDDITGSEQFLHEDLPESANMAHYRVRASRGTSNSPWVSVTVQLTGGARVPNAIPVLDESNLEATDRTLLNQIDLEWKRDSNAETGGITPTGYLIDYRIGTGDGDSFTAATGSNGLDGRWQRLQANTGYSRPEYHHRGLDPGTTVQYRIFPWHKNLYGEPGVIVGSTKAATTPDPVRGLTVVADGPTRLELDWPAVTENGGAPITGYFIQVADDHDVNLGADATWSRAGETEANVTAYTYAPTGGDALQAGDIRWFRVFAINSVNTDGGNPVPNEDDEASAEPVMGRTASVGKPNPPEHLTAERAKTSNLIDASERGVLLLWNAGGDPAGGEIEGYVIDRKVDDGEWEQLEDQDGRDTFYTDPSQPAAGELRTYRVRTKSANGALSDWSNEATYRDGDPEHTHNTAPMAVDSIDDQTVAVGATVDVDVAANFRDADAGDTLTYTVADGDDSIATATVSGSTVTITGVAVGSATTTVTATDMEGATATQTFMVTVTSAELTAPTNVMAEVGVEDPGSVTVTWTDGAGADQHAVILFDSNWEFGDRIAAQQTDGTETFEDVPSGDYTAVVVALDADFNMEIGFATVTVP